MTAHRAYVIKERYSYLSSQLSEYAYDSADDGPEVALINFFRMFPDGARDLRTAFLAWVQRCDSNE